MVKNRSQYCGECLWQILIYYLVIINLDMNKQANMVGRYESKCWWQILVVHTVGKCIVDIAVNMVVNKMVNTVGKFKSVFVCQCIKNSVRVI